MASVSSSTMVPPVQDRSRASQDRLLKTARELIEEKGFENASLREICRRAGLTSGAFYARFSGKRDLALHFLDHVKRHLEAIQENFATDLSASGLEAAVRNLFGAQIDFYRKEGAVLRGLVVLLRNDVEIAQAMRRINNQYVRCIQAVLLEGVTIHHPDPPLALRLAFMCTLSALAELVLNQHLLDAGRGAYAYDRETLVAELTRMFLNYLEV